MALRNPLKLPFLSAKDAGKQFTLILVSTFTWGILIQTLCAPEGTPAASQPSMPALLQCHMPGTSLMIIPSAPSRSGVLWPQLWRLLTQWLRAGGIYHTWQQVWACNSRSRGHVWKFCDLLQ